MQLLFFSSDFWSTENFLCYYGEISAFDNLFFIVRNQFGSFELRRKIHFHLIKILEVSEQTFFKNLYEYPKVGFVLWKKNFN